MITSTNNASQRTSEADDVQIEKGLKRCSRCFQLKPITEFRFHRRVANLRHTICKECNRLVELDRRRRKRQGRLFHEISDFRHANTARAVAAAAHALIVKHGGLRRFAREWWEAVEAAKGEKRTASVLRAYMTIARMVKAANELEPKLDSLSDEALANLKSRAVLDLIRAHPPIAVEAARCLGWLVIPTESVSTPGADVSDDRSADCREPRPRPTAPAGPIDL